MRSDDDVHDSSGGETTGRRAVLKSVGAGTVTAFGVAGASLQAEAASPGDQLEYDYDEETDVRVAAENFDSPDELAAAKAHAESVTFAQLKSQSTDCSGSEEDDCPPPPGECNCYFECACLDRKLYRRECCCCDDDDRNGCSSFVRVGSC